VMWVEALPLEDGENEWAKNHWSTLVLTFAIAPLLMAFLLSALILGAVTEGPKFLFKKFAKTIGCERYS